MNSSKGSTVSVKGRVHPHGDTTPNFFTDSKSSI